MSPFASSSSDLVVSFFSRDDERSRGNSFSTRAYLAATSTPRYLLAAWFAISTGVKTRMMSALGLMIHFGLEVPDQRRDALAQTSDARLAHDLGIENCCDSTNRLLELVIDHDVLVFLHSPQFVQRGM